MKKLKIKFKIYIMIFKKKERKEMIIIIVILNNLILKIKIIKIIKKIIYKIQIQNKLIII